MIFSCLFRSFSTKLIEEGEEVLTVVSEVEKTEDFNVEEFSKRVVLILRFLHDSSSDIRRTAVGTLNSLLSLRLQKVW